MYRRRMEIASTIRQQDGLVFFARPQLNKMQDKDENKRFIRDAENTNLPGSRPDLGQICSGRLNKTAGIAVLR